MGCKECGKPKCNGECGCKSPKVLQINNPAEYITFHKVSISAAMGDSTTNPPKIGAYRNALVYYEADHTSWMYSTDGIPTLVTGERGKTGDVGPQGPQGPQGPAGADGADGFSPIATVTQTSTGATISITDAQGTTTADIANGTGSNAPIATTSVAGIVKPDGSTIKVTADGTISSTAGYTLPPATNTSLGGIKVGSNLSITADGVLSADAQQVTLYSETGQNTDGAMTQKATTDALALKADSSSLAPVATSGDYNDLDNLPTLPTVNNGALTIQQNGTTLDTFTANSSDNKTINIQTITAETVAPADEVGAITTNMIADGAVTSAKVDWSTLLPSNFSALESASPEWTVFSIGRLKFIWKQISQSSDGWKDFGQIPDECVGSSMVMFQWTSLYGNNATGYSAAAQISDGHIFAQVLGINNSNGGWAFAVFA